MSCMKIRGGILTIADVSEPFKHGGRMWAVDKRWGPYPCEKNGDPTDAKVSGKAMQAAFMYWCSLGNKMHKV